MEAIRSLHSLQEIKELVNSVQAKRMPASLGLEEYKQEHYRGQGSDKYNLIASLSRNFSNTEKFIEMENLVITAFKKAMLEKNKAFRVMQSSPESKFKSEWEWLGQAQHYRLPTRLMDWSLDWRIALYFTVENESLFDQDGQFWILYCPDKLRRPEVKKEYYDIDPYQIKETLFLNPSFYWTDFYEKETAEIRRARQFGRFLSQAPDKSLIPLEDQPDIIPHLEKYIIPSGAKLQIKKELEKEGLSNEFLFANEDEEVNNIVCSIKKQYGLR